MNEQLQLALTAILAKATSGVEAGVNFLSSEIPEVIQQLLLWKLVQAGLLATVCTMLILATALLIKYCGLGEKIDPKNPESFRNHKSTLTHDRDGDVHPGVLVVGVVWCVAVPILFIVVIESIGVALQIWAAPKVYLIEYAASLAK